MSATYSGDPASSETDQVRFLLGDVGPSFELASAEVDWLLERHPEPYLAAAAGARLLAGRFAAEAERKDIGELTVQRSRDRASEMRSLAASLEAEHSRVAGAAPWANPSALGAEAVRGRMDFR